MGGDEIENKGTLDAGIDVRNGVVGPGDGARGDELGTVASGAKLSAPELWTWIETNALISIKSCNDAINATWDGPDD